jgi:hypothetical protein
VTVRDTVRPVFGTRSTRTRHVPTDLPRTDEPTKVHLDVPLTMLIRMVPCDLRGMARPAAFAMVAALADRPRRTVTRNGGEADVVSVAAGEVVVEATPAAVVVDVEVVTAVVSLDCATVDVGAVTGTVVGGDAGGDVVDEVDGDVLGTVVVAAVTESVATVAGASRLP